MKTRGRLYSLHAWLRSTSVRATSVYVVPGCRPVRRSAARRRTSPASVTCGTVGTKNIAELSLFSFFSSSLPLLLVVCDEADD